MGTKVVWTSALFLACAVSAARAQTPLQANGQLKVCGNQLCNEAGNPIQLRGVSMHGVQWLQDGRWMQGALRVLP